MHVCFMSRAVAEQGPGGGMEVHGASLIEGLATRGVRLDVVTTAHPDGSKRLERDGASFHFLGNCPAGAYSEAFFEESARCLASLHAADPVDLVLGQSGGAHGYVRSGGRERLGVPVMAVFHGIALWELRTAWAVARGPKGWARCALLSLGLLRERWRDRRAMAAYDALVAVSDELALAMRAEHPELADRIHAVPNGIDVGRFRRDDARSAAVRERLRLLPGDRLLAMAGRLVREKGCHVALEAVAALGAPAVHVLVAGGGPDEAALWRQSEALGLGARVHFAGHVSRDDLPAYLGAADLFLLPTLRWEGLPLSVAEALACGTPVVASRIGGVPSALRVPGCGRLVPPGDPGALAAAIRELLADPSALARMGHTAREDACDRLSVVRMIDDTYAVMQRVARC